MTRRTNSKVAGYVFLLYIAMGITAMTVTAAIGSAGVAVCGHISYPQLGLPRATHI